MSIGVVLREVHFHRGMIASQAMLAGIQSNPN